MKSLNIWTFFFLRLSTQLPKIFYPFDRRNIGISSLVYDVSLQERNIFYILYLMKLEKNFVIWINESTSTNTRFVWITTYSGYVFLFFYCWFEIMNTTLLHILMAIGQFVPLTFLSLHHKRVTQITITIIVVIICD